MSSDGAGAVGLSGVALRPIGRVVSPRRGTKMVPASSARALVEVFPEFEPGLHRIEEYSHLWIMCWFHEASRDRLLSSPRRVNPDLPEFGVFALRGPSRPNPISLTLVRLDAVDGRVLKVAGLDAINDTPVLDIKPYNEHDSVESPGTPYFPAVDRELRFRWLRAQALLHHQEECEWLEVGLGFAMEAEECFGHLQARDLELSVEGPACLLDVMQGITRARFANPARLSYVPGSSRVRLVWKKDDRLLEQGLPMVEPCCHPMDVACQSRMQRA